MSAILSEMAFTVCVPKCSFALSVTWKVCEKQGSPLARVHAHGTTSLSSPTACERGTDHCSSSCPHTHADSRSLSVRVCTSSSPDLTS
mmetsp:Transcript_12829/g.45036  ORF Transcript_12829/g.45036 Transcript_12829/m.45036 type:complete len:88 (-) Transcript_12829:894-1157(-)